MVDNTFELLIEVVSCIVILFSVYLSYYYIFTHKFPEAEQNNLPNHRHSSIHRNGLWVEYTATFPPEIWHLIASNVAIKAQFIYTRRFVPPTDNPFFMESIYHNLCNACHFYFFKLDKINSADEEALLGGFRQIADRVKKDTGIEVDIDKIVHIYDAQLPAHEGFENNIYNIMLMEDPGKKNNYLLLGHKGYFPGEKSQIDALPMQWEPLYPETRKKILSHIINIYGTSIRKDENISRKLDIAINNEKVIDIQTHPKFGTQK